MGNNYRQIMMSHPLVRVDNSSKLKFGQLIGFKALCGNGEVTASYQVWSHAGDEIQFILFIKNGQPVVDNTWINSEEILTNDPPVIVDVEFNHRPQTFQKSIEDFFNGI